MRKSSVPICGLFLALVACGNDNLESAVGNVTVSPAVLDLGSVWIGDWVEGSLEFTNDGRVPVTFVVAGLAPPFEGPKSVTVPALGNATTRIAFRPTEQGDVERLLSLTSSNHDLLEVKLRGRGVRPAIGVDDLLDFGAVRLGERLELPLVVHNEAPLAITDFLFSQIEGDSADSFSIVREIRQIGATETAEFRIAFTPLALGPSSARFTVAACAGCTPRQVTLKGRGVDRLLSARPSPVVFGSVLPGKTRTLVVTIENGGEIPADLAGARVEGETFSVDTATVLPVSLGQGGAVEVAVTFAPVAVGERRGILSFLDGVDVVILEIDLLGHGGGPVLVASPPAIDFGRVPIGWNGGADLLVTNVGEDVRVDVTGATIEGAAGWAVLAPSFPAAIGGGLPMRVTFIASGPAAPVAAELVLATSDPNQPEVRVPLAARVVDDTGCRIAPDPPRLRFGLVQAGVSHDRVVDLVNVGTDPCILWDLHLDPAGADGFRLMDPPPATELAPGDRLTVPLSLFSAEPSDELLTSRLLYRTSNAADPSGEVEVSGYVANHNVVAIPTLLDFGTIPVNRAWRLPLTVRRQNFGTAGLLGAALSAESTEAFGVVAAPGFPVLLDSSNPEASFQLEYHPRSAGSHGGLLEIQVQGYPEPLLVRLKGQGDGGPCGDRCDPPIPICPTSEQVIVFQDVVLEGTGVDPNGDPLTCEWTLVQAPAFSSVIALQPANDCSTFFVPDFVGDYTIRLRVRDPLGNIGECVTGYEVLPWPLVAIPDPVEFGTVPVNRMARVPLTVRLQSPVPVYFAVYGAALSTVSDLEFRVVDGPQFPVYDYTSTLTMSFQLEYLPQSAGSHDGVLEIPMPGHPDPMLVHLHGQADDEPCGVRCDPPIPICPASGQGIINQAVTMVGSGVDPNGDSLRCEWIVDQAPASSSVAAPQPAGDCTTQFTPDFVGDYTIRLRVIDPLGNFGECVSDFRAMPATLVAVPDPVDFGTIPVNRVARIPLTVTLQSPTTVRLLGAALLPGSDPEFDLAAVPYFPLVLTSARPTASFQLEYHPQSVGSHGGVLQIQVAGHPDPVLVPLHGQADDGPCGVRCDPPIPTCPASGQGIINQAVTWVGTGVDPNGDPLTCEWAVIQAPASSSTATPRPEGACTTQFIPDLVGDYVIRLRVSDPLGNFGECVTDFQAIAPTHGLWIEQYWDLPNDVDLHLMHPLAGDPSLYATWSRAPYDCFHLNKNPEWDLPGTADNPSLDRDDRTYTGPENIRIDAPTKLQEYRVGAQFFTRRSPASTWVTTKIYCGGSLEATAPTRLDDQGERVWIGTVWFDEYDECHWVPKDLHMLPP